jgi:hypothetical protein
MTNLYLSIVGFVYIKASSIWYWRFSKLSLNHIWFAIFAISLKFVFLSFCSAWYFGIYLLLSWFQIDLTIKEFYHVTWIAFNHSSIMTLIFLYLKLIWFGLLILFDRSNEAFILPLNYWLSSLIICFHL